MANWELVPIELLRVLVVGVGTVAGVIPLIWMFDPGFALVAPTTFLTPGAWSEQVASVVQLHPWRLILVLVIWLVLSLAAFLVSCFLRGGTFGVLVAADRQALPGGRRSSAWFRTFSSRNFRGWGSRLWRRYFWLANLDVVVVVLLLALAAGLALSVEWALERGKTAVAGGLGCVAVPVFVAVLIASRVWVAVARADAGRNETTVGKAAVRAVSLLGERLGTLFLLVGVVAALSFALWVCFFAVNVSLGRILGEDVLAQGIANLALAVFEMAMISLLALWFNGSLVALVRSEPKSVEQP